MDDIIEQSFQFLIDDYGCARLASESGYSYHSPALIIERSFNDRDGFETLLFFPTRGTGRVAVGTILGALDVSNPHGIESQTAFIRSNYAKLADLPLEAYHDLVALRFWHVSSWLDSWGTTITMNQAAIAGEKARLCRLKQYFAQGVEQ
jgi:hypothetical protein